MIPWDIVQLLGLLAVCGTCLGLGRMVLRAKFPIDRPDLRKINDRLDQMQEAIDAIALETERISEGQRYTTKLLSEKSKEGTPRS